MRGTIDRTSPMPLWAQLLDDLRRRINERELVDEFPTDAELQVEYALSRHTVREAVRRLQTDGVVSRHRGRGTFVNAPSIEQAHGALYSLFQSIESLGYTQTSRVLDLSETVDAAVAARLDRPASTPLVRLERLRLADDSPLAHDISWIPAEIGRPLLDADFSHTALYDELAARAGVRPTSGTEWIHTELPSADERRLLGIGAKQPVFVLERSGCEGERKIEWRRTSIRGDRYSFVTRWSPAQAAVSAFETR